MHGKLVRMSQDRWFRCSFDRSFRYELMLLCWNYLPENRVNFVEIATRLSEMLADPEREQPSTWFSYDASLPVSSVASWSSLIVRSRSRLGQYWIMCWVISNHPTPSPWKAPIWANAVHRHRVVSLQWRKARHRVINSNHITMSMVIRQFHPTDYV